MEHENENCFAFLEALDAADEILIQEQSRSRVPENTMTQDELAAGALYDEAWSNFGQHAKTCIDCRNLISVVKG